MIAKTVLSSTVTHDSTASNWTTTLAESATMLPSTYGYAWVGKSDDDFGDLDTRLPLSSDHGIFDELIFSDVASGHTSQRPS